MTWTANVLVVANVTADSDELLDALRKRAYRSPATFTLVVPATGGGTAGRASAWDKLGRAIDRMRAQGLAVEGEGADPDPIVAGHEAWDPARYDEVIVSTLPTHASRWLMVDLPRRVARITDVDVRHVISREPKPEPRVVPAPVHEKRGVLAALTPLAWGAERQQAARR